MDFGVFYEIQVNSPLKHREREAQVFHQVLEQVALAEEAGFSNFWSVEHHFQPGFSHCSAPEVLYGALSQRTSEIRIGHAVVLLPFPYNHPVRAASLKLCACASRSGRCHGIAIGPRSRDAWPRVAQLLLQTLLFSIRRDQWCVSIAGPCWRQVQPS